MSMWQFGESKKRCKHSYLVNKRTCDPLVGQSYICSYSIAMFTLESFTFTKFSRNPFERVIIQIVTGVFA